MMTRPLLVSIEPSGNQPTPPVSTIHATGESFTKYSGDQMSTHAFRTIRGPIATVATALGLAACGGGGGSAPSAPLATNATQFAFNTAIANYVNNPATLPFTISGTGTTANQQAATLSGDGTLTHATTASTFEGVAALKKNTIQVGTIRAVNVATGAIASQPKY